MNKTFATFGRGLKKDRYLESIQAHFLLLPSYRRFPTDDEFKRELQLKDLYNFRSRSYWLRRLENHDRKERVPVDEYTIEHILPQNENLSAQWKAELGPEWERIQETYLHTLGNLTLTGYNSEYSDRPFVEKRDMKGGFARKPAALEPGTWRARTLERGDNQAAGRTTGGAGGGCLARCLSWRRMSWRPTSRRQRRLATPSMITRTWPLVRCTNCSRRSASRCWRSIRA